MTDISTDLAKFRDHARKQATQLETRIQFVERDLARSSRRAGKTTKLKRLEVLGRELQLWNQLAGEIDTYEQHTADDPAELDLWEPTP